MPATQFLSSRGPIAIAPLPRRRLTRPRTCSCACSAARQAAPEATTTASERTVQQQMQQVNEQWQQQQQQMVQRRATPAAPPPPPFAALRMLLTGQNPALKTLQKKPGGGPISLLLFALTVIAAAFAALRSAIMRKVRRCKCCRGFGVTRCRLCDGQGRVDWAAKLSHYAACPLCMNRRYVVCTDCGGGFHRPLFGHQRRRQGADQDLGDLYQNAAAGAALSSVDAPDEAVKTVSRGVLSARND
ncbi:hypothetical protein Rsub_11184 [Raphidocelis subcapitata]|uniref:Uncharacterized protein n=1 Tax=Raphidocelis subcapitata TaxID=307507 RepID=A0A2V0PDA7_9CHLO|nr:hypothetical protein Rsub_11184 [Raphidocelis subcapitata]|eukprot:GBF97834.1 hypothetical protein Rsub_11184 [Raphidocelis subcapitata]